MGSITPVNAEGDERVLMDSEMRELLSTCKLNVLWECVVEAR